MKRNTVTLCTSVLLLTALGALGLGKPKEAAQNVSMVRLIAVPERFSGQRVQTQGWLSVGFSGADAVFRLYHSREALDFSDLTESLLLDSASLAKLLPDSRSAWMALHGEHVLVQGTFKWADPKGDHDINRALDAIDFFLQTKAGSPIFNK